MFVIRTKAENGAASEYLTRRSQMNDFGVWTKMTPRPLPALHRSFVFINDGGKKKEEGKRKREGGRRAALMCFIVEGDRSLETCMVRGRRRGGRKEGREGT